MVKFTNAAWIFSILLVGITAAVLAVGEAYEGSDQSSDIIATMHPIVDQLFWIVGFAVVIVGAITIVAAAKYLLSAQNGVRR